MELVGGRDVDLKDDCDSVVVGALQKFAIRVSSGDCSIPMRVWKIPGSPTRTSGTL
ncbi:hypothetical protein PAXINDRAFT_16896 [Paxillus involutus ATCC 200175]|uniref:Uncharacterized protein n=1 Tax=Paxillus involutus ATCC 200175 TaxID=664439 RepID=A0A0C9TS72_PAXIN|nr:hypothetical protein PAXINDRAFT_16896 [Paxillus involutus ATCC 200175]